MEFSVAQNDLLDCLNHFQSVVERRNTIPILSNIKIIAENNSLAITATDLALELTENLEANIINSGGITVQSQLFFDIVRKAPSAVEIKVKKDSKTQQIFVFYGKSKFSIPTLPVDDFPVMDQENLDVNFEIDSSNLINLIDKCKFCMGVDESRQYLNGIYFHTSGDMITSVATDGHRLSKCLSTELINHQFEGIIIPKKTVFELSKILESNNGKIEVSFSKTRLRFVLGKIKILSKLINSSFPDYESVIPKDNDQIMEVDCKSFSETIDRVSTISSEKFRTVKFDISNNSCVVSSFGADKSLGTESIDVNYQGSEFSINFNAKYILDVLNLIKEGKVKFYFSKDTAPTILESDSLKNAIFLIMQMRA